MGGGQKRVIVRNSLLHAAIVAISCFPRTDDRLRNRRMNPLLGISPHGLATWMWWVKAKQMNKFELIIVLFYGHPAAALHLSEIA